MNEKCMPNIISSNEKPWSLPFNIDLKAFQHIKTKKNLRGNNWEPNYKKKDINELKNKNIIERTS